MSCHLPRYLSVPLTPIRIFYYTSFTPYVITFVRCVSNSDRDDLALLKEVLDTLEQTSLHQKHSNRQYELCKALYRTATEHLASRSTAPEQFGHADSGHSAWFDTNELLDPFISGRAGDWDSITTLDHIMFHPGNRPRGSNT